MTNIEHVLTWMCGFGAADAKPLPTNARAISTIGVGLSTTPQMNRRLRKIVSWALLRAVDGHVSTLTAEEQRRLEHAVRALHETFSEPEGLIEAV